MAFVNVYGTGEKYDACKYLTKSIWVALIQGMEQKSVITCNEEEVKDEWSYDDREVQWMEAVGDEDVDDEE